MKLEAILFDLDGTLIDSVAVILRASREVCGYMGIPYDEVQMRNWIGIPLKVQAGLLTKEREDEFVRTYTDVYRSYHTESDKLFDGTAEMLDKLHRMGLRTGLVTSKNDRGTQRVLGLLGLEGKFEAIITADHVENPKPHGEPIVKALEALDITPDEAVYVGDSFFDYESAADANVPMVAVSWGARTREDLQSTGAKAVVDSWGEFITWVEEQSS